MYIKERDKPNFDSISFGTTIIRDDYMIHNSHIFYTYQDKPFMDGILDMEELLDNLDQ